jgi:hypothetical protein
MYLLFIKAISSAFNFTLINSEAGYFIFYKHKAASQCSMESIHCKIKVADADSLNGINFNSWHFY